MGNPKPMNILLVEDDDVAAESVQRGLERSGVNFPVTVAIDGLDALDILRGRHATARIAKPYIVLLDLNMPRMNGFEFLQELRHDDRLKESIIFVLTTSDSDSDRSKAYHENIAGYMVKSAVGPQFSKLVHLLKDYYDSVSFP